MRTYSELIGEFRDEYFWNRFFVRLFRDLISLWRVHDRLDHPDRFGPVRRGLFVAHQRGQQHVLPERRPSPESKEAAPQIDV